MPRRARRKSKTGIYHVVLRGINRQIIFEDEEDHNRLLETLKTYKAICEYRLFAYCLMGNHFHLLLEVGKEDLGLILKRIAGSYVYWYNLKYRRNGHLFQDRYKSEPVEDDGYFLSVLRYIHRNPLKAGICGKIEDYEYSSYNAYNRGDSSILDIEYVFSMIGRDGFFTLSKETGDEKCLDAEKGGTRINDADAITIIQRVSQCTNAVQFQLLENKLRDRYIKELKASGLSIRQISRLTGVSFGIVRKE